MDSKLLEINELKEKISSLRQLSLGEVEKLNENFMLEYTYDSNAIEGSALTLDETALVIKEKITISGKPVSDHFDAIGHKDAFYYILDLVKDNKMLSESEILNIHNLVLMSRPDDRRKFRKIPVQIMGSNAELAQPFMIKPGLDNLLNWYHEEKSMHIVEKIALFHLKFERIHPFIDGNGRCGRLIINFELMKNGLLPINIKNINKKDYYDAFKSYDELEDFKVMTNLIADYLIFELEKYISILETN